MNKPIKLQGGKLYSKVVDRLHAFRQDHPALNGWSIKTEVWTMSDNYVVFKAMIINQDGEVLAIGHGFNGIAKDKAFEKAETVAVGRALAFFDPKYGGDYELASADEIEKFNDLNKQSVSKPSQPQPKSKANGVDAIVNHAMDQLSNGHSNEMDMPFGKYKGMLVSQLPGDYIEWVLSNMPQIDDELRQELVSVINAKRPELNG